MRDKTCEYYARCGKSGHYYDGGRWRRCECLEREANKLRLGVFNTANVRDSSSLSGLREKDLLVEGPIRVIREHVARVLLDMAEEGKSYYCMDAYRLVEIFLDKDEEFKTSQDLADFDLLVMLLGFGDVANRRLPDLILQALNRRELVQRPTWVVMGLPLASVPTKYDAAVFERLSQMRKASVNK